MADLEPAPRGYPIKLVRDGTPEAINPSGEPGELFYELLDDADDRAAWLRKKLGEEVTEYLLEPGPDELADVLAVVHALAQEEHALGWEGLLRLLRDHPRGGFIDGLMMYGRHPEFDGEEPR